MDVDDPVPEAIRERLVTDIRAVFRADLVGIYLYGSYVSGGFDPGVSDLDLGAAAAPPVEAIDLAGLGRMHRDFIGRHPAWDDRVEVVYVGRAALGSFRTSPGPLAVISPGEPFHLRDERAVAWLQNSHLVRETGGTLYGPTLARSSLRSPGPSSSRPWCAMPTRSAAGASRGQPRRAVYAVSDDVLVRPGPSGAQAHGSKQEAAAWIREQRPGWPAHRHRTPPSIVTRSVLGPARPADLRRRRQVIGLMADQIVAPSLPGHRACVAATWAA